MAPLRALVAAGCQVKLVVTRPPRRRGRGGLATMSPVGTAASGLGLEVTWSLDDAAGLPADLGVVVAYGEMISDSVLRARRTVNLHFSLLPRWRGAAPVERAILAGDSEAGVCLMEVVGELDAGRVYSSARTPIAPDDTAESLRARLCALGTGLLLDALAGGFGTPQPQAGTVTWAAKIDPAELRIDWAAPAEHVLRLVRVGGAWTTFRGKRLKVLAARPAPAAASADVRLAGESGPDAFSQNVAQVGAKASTATVQRGASEGPLPELKVPLETVRVTVGQRGDSERTFPEGIVAPTAGTVTVRRGPDGREAVLVAAGDAGIELLTVQAEGRGATGARQWSNGARLSRTERLGE